MITVEGKNGIKATILADSISKLGVRFLTFEIEYPRIILAELNTHKMLSKNSFSSRAVPFHKMIQQLEGQPVRFGANQGGMQDKGEDYDATVEIPDYLHEALDAYITKELDAGLSVADLKDDEGKVHVTALGAWDFHKFMSTGIASALNDAKYHKQVYNRLLEAHQMMKTVISGTEWDNFFWLRDHEAADPSLHELARVMQEAKDKSTPVHLNPGQWHLPYVDWFFDKEFNQVFYLRAEEPESADSVGLATPLTFEEAIKVSCARCAAVSYRNEGYGVAKSIEVYDRLVGDERKHASAFEHCATPIADSHFYNGVNLSDMPGTWQEGITHVTRDRQLWSGNLKGWIQYRKLIKGENYERQ